jgi:hypothetical protein
MAGKYRIGTGIAEVTDRAIGLQMQGFADNRQQTKHAYVNNPQAESGIDIQARPTTRCSS